MIEKKPTSLCHFCGREHDLSAYPKQIECPCGATLGYTWSWDLHPYYCDGRGKCRHCDREQLPGHDPETCEQCTERIDGD